MPTTPLKPDTTGDACRHLAALLSSVAAGTGRAPVLEGVPLSPREAFAADGLLPVIVSRADGMAGRCAPGLRRLSAGVVVEEDPSALSKLAALPDGNRLSAVAVVFAVGALLDAAERSPAGTIEMGLLFPPAETVEESPYAIDNAKTL